MRKVSAVLASVAFVFAAGGALHAATDTIAEPVSVSVLPDGVTATRGEDTLTITALRDDVLRVTASHERGHMPEKASWAVLPAALSASAAVTPDSSGGAAGFRTTSLQVSISADLQVTIRDAAGKVLQEDALPSEWHSQWSLAAAI